MQKRQSVVHLDPPLEFGRRAFVEKQPNTYTSSTLDQLLACDPAPPSTRSGPQLSHVCPLCSQLSHVRPLCSQNLKPTTLNPKPKTLNPEAI